MLAERIIQANLQAESVDLSGLGILSIETLTGLLARMPRLHNLDLSHNELAFLPEDCSMLRHVQVLNLDGNPISDIASVLAGLRSMESLRHLHLTLGRAEEEDVLTQALPSLTSLNGVLVDIPECGNARVNSVDDGAAEPFAGWTAEDAATATQLFEATTTDAEKAAPRQEYMDYLRRVENHVSCLVAAETDPLQQQGEVLKAHRLLFEFCFKVLARQIARRSEEDGQRVSAALTHCMGLLDSYDSLWRRVVSTRDVTVDLMKEDMRSAIHEIETLMSVPAAPAPAMGDGETSAVSETPAPVSDPVPSDERVTPRHGARGTNPRTPASRAKGYACATSPGRSAGSSRLPSASSTRAKKTLSFKQLKELVEDIYASKNRYDVKCGENHLPRETMEQHMYTYLNQRFGLKEIIVEWATAIMEGLKRYGPDDNDIAVFGKILRNEIDEEFRFVQCKVRETIRELLRVFVARQNPLKGNIEVAALVEKSTQGGLREAEWEYIVGYMYNSEDAAALTSLIRKQLYFLNSPRKVTAAKSPKRTKPYLLPYADFMRLLLNFQLAGHERFLAPFAKLFRKYDANQDGIISGFEFRAIALALDPYRTEQQVEDMLSHIDPLGSQLITFSDCVALFSEELFRLQAK